MSDKGRLWEVEYMDSEHNVYTIWVRAHNEEDAEEYAWNEASDAYHGPKEILSVC